MHLSKAVFCQVSMNIDNKGQKFCKSVPLKWTIMSNLNDNQTPGGLPVYLTYEDTVIKRYLACI